MQVIDEAANVSLTAAEMFAAKNKTAAAQPHVLPERQIILSASFKIPHQHRRATVSAASSLKMVAWQHATPSWILELQRTPNVLRA
jgi:hypothetical protein